MNPELVIFTGPMFGGKTSKMLAALERAKYQKKNILLFKPKLDDRYTLTSVVTHNGVSWDSINITHKRDIFTYVKSSTDIIAIDEAFMLEGVDTVVLDLFYKGYTIYLSSIQLSADLRSFENIKELLPFATRIEICSAVCSKCSQDAYYSKALRQTELIDVGGSETYEPRCFKHYFNE